MATVDVDGLAGQESDPFNEEGSRETSHFGYCAHSSQRNAAFDARYQRGVTERVLIEAGTYISGRQGHHRYFILGPFDCQGPRQARHRRFGRRICKTSRHAELVEKAAHVDDQAFRLLKIWIRHAAAFEYGDKVELHDRPQLVSRHLTAFQSLVSSGVVDQAADAPGASGEIRERRRHHILVLDVAAVRHDAPFLAAGDAASAAKAAHCKTPVCELLSNGRSEATAGPGHKNATTRRGGAQAVNLFEISVMTKSSMVGSRQVEGGVDDGPQLSRRIIQPDSKGAQEGQLAGSGRIRSLVGGSTGTWELGH